MHELSGARPVPASERRPVFPGQGEFRQLLERLPAAAYTCDADGLITYFNARARELWGRAPALNSPADRFCGSFRLYSRDGATIPHEVCWMAKALETGNEYNGAEMVIERADGVRVAVLAHAAPIRDESGRLLGAVNVLVDISDRLRAEDALHDSRQEREVQFADLERLNQMSAHLWTTLEVQPTLQEVLETACAIERAQMGMIQLCVEPDALEVAANVGFDADTIEQLCKVPGGAGACGKALAQRGRVVVEDTEREPLCADYRSLARAAGFRAVHCTPLTSRSGQIIGVLSTQFAAPRRPSAWQMHMLDLCARQAVDFVENARLYTQINEAQRRKDEFLALLAHELRNPLAPIRNAAQILARAGVHEADRQWAGAVIERQVAHMARLIDDLLDLSRITTGKLALRKEPLALATMLDAAVETCRPLIEARRHELVVELPGAAVELDGDLTRLAQVVANLLDNAAKYTPVGGRITLRGAREGDEAVIRVRDNGIGIPPEGLTRIFQMFIQAPRAPDQAQAGLGIGLTLCKRLVELHGGTIVARSDGVGRGSEFIVRLPAHACPAHAAAHAAAPAQSVPGPSGLRIVVVDDNRDSASSLEVMLCAMGNEVRTGHDGRQAVELAEGFRPDVVLLDIGLPVIDGCAAARAIRAAHGGSGPVLVAITGWGQDSDRARSREAGFDHHLVKPLDIAALLGILRAVRPERAPSAPARKPRHGQKGASQTSSVAPEDQAVAASPAAPRA